MSASRPGITVTGRHATAPMTNSSPLRLIDAELADIVGSSVGWKLQAACTGRLDLFFAKKAERPEARTRREAKAKRLCDVCPVLTECRTTARTNREYGYWAGESEEERHLLGFRVTAPIGIRARLADKESRQDRSA